MKTLKGLLWLIPLALHAQAKNVTVTWNDTVNPSNTTYNVYRSTGSCPVTIPTTAVGTKVGVSLAVKTFTEPIAFGTFCYQVTALNGTTESSPAQGNAINLTLSPPITITITIQ